MSRKNQSIAIAILVALLIAPVSAWAKPAAAVDFVSVEAPTFSGWLELLWSRVVHFVQAPDKSEPADTTSDDEPPPNTETGASGDPWG